MMNSILPIPMDKTVIITAISMMAMPISPIQMPPLRMQFTVQRKTWHSSTMTMEI